MSFLRAIKDSIYNPDFYAGLFAKSFKFSLGYFYSLVITVAVVVTIFASITLVPLVQNFVTSIGPKVIAAYPADLVITVKGGKASTNVAEPFFIKFPPELKKENDKYENLIVLDTKDVFTLDSFRSYKTRFLLTRDSVVSSDDSGKISVQPLDRFGDYQLDKSKIENFINRLQPYAKFVPPFVIFAIFFGLIIFMSGKLIYLIAGTLLVWLAAKIRKLKIGYKKSYQFSLHLITLPLIIENILHYSAGLQISGRFIFSGVLFVMALINLRPAPAEITIEPLPSSSSPENPVA